MGDRLSEKRLRAALDELDDVVDATMRLYGSPGLSLAIANRDGLVDARAYGLADVADGRPMTPETIFRAGSMSKLYTATAVLQLIDDGRLALEDELNDHLDDLQVDNPLGERPITLHDLMTHRSGLAGNSGACGFAPPVPLDQHLKTVLAAGTGDFYRGVAGSMWTAPVGAKLQYSNTGLALLGLLVERCNPDGLAFADYVQRRIIDPLGMKRTTMPAVQLPSDEIASGYSSLGQIKVPSPWVHLGDTPAGNVLTTPTDHAELLRAFMNEGGGIVRPGTVKEALREQGGPYAPGVDMGLIWWVLNRKPSPAFGHSGAHMWGWMNLGLAWPDLDLVVVVSENHWPLFEGPHAPRYGGANVICNWLANRMAGSSDGVSPPDATWAWKASYLAGVTLVERLVGVLSIDEPFTDEMLEAAVTGSPGGTDWDAEGFRSGVEAARRLSGHPLEYTEFLRSNDVATDPALLPLLTKALGGTGNSPLQLDYQELPGSRE